MIVPDISPPKLASTLKKALYTDTAVGSGRLETWIVDVGQGNLIIVKFPNGQSLLVDAGSTSTYPGEAAILSAVNDIMGTATFSTVVLTHPDNDHCNLIPEIVRYAPNNVHHSMVEANYSPAMQQWFKMVDKKKGHIWSYVDNYHNIQPQTNFGSGAVKVYILAANVQGDSNTHSIVLALDYKNKTVVLTGDATAQTERWILSQWDESSLMGSMLCFGHHGSNHSSSPKFISVVAPDVGIFSASANHMGYGHPRCSVYDYVLKFTDSVTTSGVTVRKHRLECWQITPPPPQYIYDNNTNGVFLTATQGSLSYDTDGDNYEVWADKLGV